MIFVLLIGALDLHSDELKKPRFNSPQTVIYAAGDINKASDWYTTALGIEPYFKESFYVGFSVNGYELALDPDATPAETPGTGVMVYWGVDDIEGEIARLIELGATELMPVHDTGGGILVGSVLDPFGNALGLIVNPHFKLD